MEWFALILLLALGLFLLFLVVVQYARVGHRYLLSALASLDEDLRQGATRVAERLERRAERHHLGRRFAVAAGATSAVDEDAVEARRQMPVIRRMVENDLPEAIVRCIRMHFLAACAVGARYINDVADEPECAGSRRRVIGIAGVAVELLERYPYLVEDELLMANLITLRSRIVPICSNCPYLQYRVGSTPVLCPTAITARIDPERLTHEVH